MKEEKNAEGTATSHFDAERGDSPLHALLRRMDSIERVQRSQYVATLRYLFLALELLQGLARQGLIGTTEWGRASDAAQQATEKVLRQAGMTPEQIRRLFAELQEDGLRMFEGRVQ
jgi:hypothetical protein